MTTSWPVSIRFTLLPVLVASLGLLGSLAMGLQAAPDATRVAVVVLPGVSPAWAAIERSGLPVVQVRFGGLLVVVDGAAAPGGLALLRQARVLILDAARVPACSDAAPGFEGETDEPDA